MEGKFVYTEVSRHACVISEKSRFKGE